MTEKPPKPLQPNTRIEEKRKCSYPDCGGILSMYNKTGECHRHGVPDSSTPSTELPDRMPSSGDRVRMNPTHGKRTPSRKRDK
jgi:hypothetical protein